MKYYAKYLMLVFSIILGTAMFANVTNKDLVNRLEEVIHNDIGRRGISNFWTEGALFDAAEIINRSDNVIILTGFYIQSVKTAETDGPCGAIAIANAAASLSKKVTIVTDKYEYTIVQTGVLASSFPNMIKVIPLNTTKDIDTFIKKIEPNSCVVSIERLGRAIDNKYYSMSGTDLSLYTAPLDEIVLKSKDKDIKTIGIGDGGNEIGMGNRYNDIVEFVSHGKTIATKVKADVLITAGVSNWAGYALAFALQILNPTKKVVTPTVESARKVLDGIVSVGSVDGVTSENIDSVDGFPFNTHADIIRTMRIIMVQRIYPKLTDK